MIFVCDKAEIAERCVRRIGRRIGKADLKLSGKLYFMDKAQQVIRSRIYITGDIECFVGFYAA